MKRQPVKKPPTSKSVAFNLVGAQELNLGPEDYESTQPKKTTKTSKGYASKISVCSVLCSGFNVFRRTTDSLFGLENQK